MSCEKESRRATSVSGIELVRGRESFEGLDEEEREGERKGVV